MLADSDGEGEPIYPDPPMRAEEDVRVTEEL